MQTEIIDFGVDPMEYLGATSYSLGGASYNVIIKGYDGIPYVGEVIAWRGRDHVVLMRFSWREYWSKLTVEQAMGNFCRDLVIGMMYDVLPVRLKELREAYDASIKRSTDKLIAMMKEDEEKKKNE